MNTFEIKMPKLGESITEGTILSWSVKPGDHVQEDDILFEVSTAKVSAEIPSPIAGKVVEIFFQEGDTVAVGTVVATLLPDGEEEDQIPTEQTEEKKETTQQTPEHKPNNPVSDTDSGAPSQTQPKPAEAHTETQTKTQLEQQETTAAKKNGQSNKNEESDRWYSPIVLQLAQEAGLTKKELDQIPGTGYMGRLSKKDIKEYVTRRKAGNNQTLAQSDITSESTSNGPSDQPMKTDKPSTSTKTPSPEKPAVNQLTPPASATPSTSKSTTGQNEGNTILEMDRVRRIIADHMVRSKQISPHVTSVIEVDVTRLVQWRNRTKETFFKKEEIKLTYMPAIAEAVVKALAEYPTVNASVEGYQVILKKQINLGIAVSLPDGNLIVPVIHDADKLNLTGLASAIDTLASQARANQLSLDKMQGGTFTITNFGTFKSLFGTPIINQPEVAILAVGYIEKKPCVIETPEGDTIAIRHKMYLSLSYDHRIIDGALGGAFLRRIGDIIENWNA